ncbi:MAG: ribosome recycling factor [Bacteroidetes bacterium]|nr:ribosome recycling factor [Bacteroidota bacterium]
MNEEVQFCLDEAEESMQGAMLHLEKGFQKIRAGKASPQMLDGVMVNYYGVPTAIAQTANINTPDPRQIIVQPWDKSILHDIEKAILAANLGFNPSNEGEVLRILVPAITEQRRLELVKQAKAEAEKSKISIRSARRSANEYIKQLEKEGLAEDEAKRTQDIIQELTNKFIEKVDKLMDIKENDIMKV